MGTGRYPQVRYHTYPYSSNEKTNDFASLSDPCSAFMDPERDFAITPKVEFVKENAVDSKRLKQKILLGQFDC